jgi:hypothetical protein
MTILFLLTRNFTGLQIISNFVLLFSSINKMRTLYRQYI